MRTFAHDASATVCSGMSARSAADRRTQTAANAATALTDRLRERRHGPRGRRARAKLSEGAFKQAVSDGAVADAEESLAVRIRAHLNGGRLQVKLTDNRYTMLSVRRENESIPQFQVRLHHMFADATPTVTQALARYIGMNDAEASKVLGDFIDANQHRVRPKSPRKGAKLETKGVCHDLQAMYDSLNLEYFGGTIDATITWGQRCGKPRRRNSIKMGSYAVEDRCIRIHRSLDRPLVPQFFVEWIVYHEMLHQVHKAPVVNGRRQFHTKAFLEDEARFEHYTLATLWERDHIDQLLTY